MRKLGFYTAVCNFHSVFANDSLIGCCKATGMKELYVKPAAFRCLARFSQGLNKVTQKSSGM